MQAIILTKLLFLQELVIAYYTHLLFLSKVSGVFPKHSSYSL